MRKCSASPPLATKYQDPSSGPSHVDQPPGGDNLSKQSAVGLDDLHNATIQSSTLSLPRLWVPSLVNNRQHNGRVWVLGCKVNTERELAEQTAPTPPRKIGNCNGFSSMRANAPSNWSMNCSNRPALRVPYQLSAESMSAVASGVTMTRVTSYVLVAYFCRSSARISLHGRAANGSRRWASRRSCTNS